jgi:hypothetical protein
LKSDEESKEESDEESKKKSDEESEEESEEKSEEESEEKSKAKKDLKKLTSLNQFKKLISLNQRKRLISLITLIHYLKWVTRFMNEFMMRGTKSLMQWMLNLRTYKLKIHYNSISSRHVNWN